MCVNHLKDVKVLTCDYLLEGVVYANLFQLAGGRSIMVSLLPTKTLTIDGDTRLGQSGVPALL